MLSDPLPAPDLMADPEGWPFRHVAMSCDHPGGCDEGLDCGDIRADTFAQAMPAAVGYARAHGWAVTDDGRTAHCPTHTAPTDPATLLGVPQAPPVTADRDG